MLCGFNANAAPNNNILMIFGFYPNADFGMEWDQSGHLLGDKWGILHKHTTLYQAVQTFYATSSHWGHVDVLPSSWSVCSAQDTNPFSTTRHLTRDRADGDLRANQYTVEHGYLSSR